MTIVSLARDLQPASWGEAAVMLRGVNHVFGAGTAAKQVLFDFSLNVAAGEIVLLMGPSGCGKTTVLTLTGALRSLQNGFVTTLGTQLRDADEPTMLSVRRRIGFIYQSHNLHESLTAMENVRMALEVHGVAALAQWRDQCLAALSAVGLSEYTESYPAKLSGGQKQRVAIARALVARPPLVLADEPTAALDKTTGRQIVDLLEKLAREQGSAILMVTHDNRILDIADRIVEMEDGRVVNATVRR